MALAPMSLLYRLCGRASELVIGRSEVRLLIGALGFFFRVYLCHLLINTSFSIIIIIKISSQSATARSITPCGLLGSKTSLLPKLGEFKSENQRPITCLNAVYKWFTSFLLKPMDEHLETYGLMEVGQRGTKEGCSRTTDYLFIDRMVTQDCHRGRRNLSMAWVDVSKA